jgi:von Willebrand factor type A domain
MGHRPAVAVLWLFSVLTVHAQATRGAVDWIFLVDTSKSMLANNVFAEVQGSLESFVREASPGDSVSLYTFDRDVRSHGLRDISGDFDREEVFETVRALEANGNRTHLGAAIAKGLERSEDLLRRKPDKTRARALVLFTDGKEDVRGIPDPIPIDASVQRVATSYPSVFFVSMGEHESQLDAFKTARVIRATDASSIREVAQQIRHEIKPPPAPQLATRNIPAPTARPALPPEPPSLTPWLILAAFLLVAAIAVYAIHKSRNQLEGEIEIVQPRVASDAAYVGLPNLKSNEIALSSIVPIDALAGSDARLFVKRKSGEKRVWIAASSGSLRVNDIEVPLTELYDADTIQLGDAKLRFNHIGHTRPQEDFPA